MPRKKAAKTAGSVRGDSAYQLKISLGRIQPPIWRQVRLKGSSTFKDLHRVIQTTMGWEDSHLHEFKIGDRLIGMPDDESPQTEEEADFRLDEILPKAGTTFSYDYDFGDGWVHDIQVEAIEPIASKEDLPRCVDGARACPPEDCGGPYGYDDFLKALRDPANERHEELTEWVGGSFDPEHFDLAEVNDLLTRQFWRHKRRRPGKKAEEKF